MKKLVVIFLIAAFAACSYTKNASAMKEIHTKEMNMSEIFVHADENLELDASDMSRIRYSGCGEVTKADCENMSSIRKK